MKVFKNKQNNLTKYTLVAEGNTLKLETIQPLFAAKTIDGANLVTKQSVAGRGGTFFFDFQHKQFVTKHYYRGGLIAKIASDKYLWSGLKNTRVYQEMKLLALMFGRGLPVSQPFAALIKKQGLFYQADSITYRIDNASSLADESRNKTHDYWPLVGKTIKLFHDNNIDHADLNAHNILISNEQVFLIDFDKAKQRSRYISAWKERNIQRLYRSLKKIQKKEGIYFTESNWQSLVYAYQSS